MISGIWDDGFFTCSSEGEWVVAVVVVCCDLEFLLARSIKANDDEAPGMKWVWYVGCKFNATTYATGGK
jgi:hypothetical protein